MNKTVGIKSLKIKKQVKTDVLETLQRKAALFDRVMEVIADQNLGMLMKESEKEKNISLDKARGML